MTSLADFELPPALEASEPPEARGIPRDAVRMLVSRRRTGEISHHPFTGLPSLLLPGDLLVVNISATLPAAVRSGPGLVMHFSTPLPDGSWLAELRTGRGPPTQPSPPAPHASPPATARLVDAARQAGGRVVAVGTTVVRALETAAAAREHAAGGPLPASAGWTHHLVTPQAPPRVVDALFTGLHEPRSSHLLMLNAFAGSDLLRPCYAPAVEQ